MKELLIEAREEILRLRRSNEVLTSQVGIVDVFAAALGLRRETERGMTIDVAWKLEREIENLIHSTGAVVEAGQSENNLK